VTSPTTLDVVATHLSDAIEAHGAGRFRAFADYGELVLQGWVVAPSTRPTGIALRGPDDELVARAPIAIERPDIAEAYPGVDGAETCGFRLHLSPRSPGACSLHLYATLGGDLECLLGSVDVRAGDVRWPGSERSIPWTITAVDGESAKVLRGRDGWLFLRRDSNDVIGQHLGRVSFSDEDREAWRRLLEGRAATVERLGAEWDCIVVPDKEAVYPEHLPTEIVPAARRPIHDFLDIAEGVGAPVTYLLDDLMAEKAHAELYYRNDTHWNHRGAFVCYRSLCRRLAKRGIAIDPVEETDITWVKEVKTGDLGEKCYPEPVASPSVRARVENQQAELLYDNELRNHGRVMIFERPGDKRGASCVAFGESFVEGLLPFLKETFRRLVFVHTSMLVEEVVRIERPDVVLTVPVERFLMKIPDDHDALAQLARLAGQKGASLPWTDAERIPRQASTAPR
jgi:alginate O-acetyltransferase complex protein AlgJ